MTDTRNMPSPRRVCVIGAGIAGLAAAKVLRNDGFEVCVFEKEDRIGGVWIPSRTYPGLRTNTPREAFAFSDFPHPEGTDDFPTASQVRSYLDAYARRFDVLPHVRLSRRVVSVSISDGGFRVVSAGARDFTGTQNEFFDFVAVCNGVFSEPSVPAVEGRERFRGVIVHSSEFTDPGVARGKRVVVAGAGKSALDCATTAARESASCTLIVREPHWMMPRWLPGRVRMDRLFATRASESLLPVYHHATTVEKVLHRAGAPLLRAFWRVQNLLIPRVCGMPTDMKPGVPLPDGLEKSGVGCEFYSAVANGRARITRGRMVSFNGPDSVVLDSGKELRADLVVLATGWRQDVSFLDADLGKTVLGNGRFRLYRHILPASNPRLGFIGYASSIASPLTSELSAHWLSQTFRSELILPRVEEMEREIDRVLEWTSRVYPERSEGYVIGLYVAHYADELLRDMGLRTQRTSNVLSEQFGPLWAERYAGVAEERRRLRLEKARYASQCSATVPRLIR
jgi:cation diffusion facilitator CzcD-associated flavoprotein CzcO